ncbi:MAG TPA: hypothetical protein VIF39_03490, partial [Hyphomicrobium sp.]
PFRNRRQCRAKILPSHAEAWLETAPSAKADAVIGAAILGLLDIFIIPAQSNFNLRGLLDDSI